TSTRLLTVSLLVASAALLPACDTGAAEPAGGGSAGNPITGEGLPNPAPVVIANWGEKQPGREWGSSAGNEIDPTDGHLWAYERCGSGSAGGPRSEEHTSELQSRENLVCRLLLEKKKYS